MAFTSYSDLINKQTDPTKTQTLFVVKNGRSGGAALAATGNCLRSFWIHDGTIAKGALPTTAVTHDNTNDGAIKHTLAGAGKSLALTGFLASMTPVNGYIMLLDRLASIGSLVANITSEQLTASLAVARNTGGEGNKIFIELYSASGSTATTLTVKYTNQAGVANRVSGAARIGGTGFSTAYQLIPVPLMDGDTGVRSVESVTLLATTGTAGNFGVTIAREVFQAATGVPIPTQAGFKGIATIPDQACLFFAGSFGNSVVPELIASLQLTEN